jgi:UDP-2,3-diacylglucosamine hydrolase
MRIVFLSDAHLKKEETARIAYVTRLIETVSKNADMVFILGDLFEFYHGHEDYIYPWYRPVIEMLRELARNKPVHYVEGNHEFGMGSFFQSYTGIRSVNEMSLLIEGKKCFISHGDEIGPLPLKKLLKSAPVYALMDLFGPALTWKIAMGCRLFLSKRNKPYSVNIRDEFRAYGRKRIDEGYDSVILAHTHMADLLDYEVDGPKTYVNTGALIEHHSFAEYTSEKGFSLRTYDGEE